MSEGQITVWCLLGKKAGDNTQVRALAAQLAWPVEEKTIVARPWELWVHAGSGVTLAGIDRNTSSPLQAPWPDVVISAGRRNEPVAQWIKQQSGGRSRLVHMGRPWAPLASWDLIITTPQYFLPAVANVLHNTLPLHRVTADDLRRAGEQWQPHIAHLPRPWIALLAGGDSGPFVMTPNKGSRLGSLASEVSQAAGGSLLVSDSPRTPVSAGDALQSALRGPHISYRCASGDANPYRGLLALADAFIVTGESMSMLGEAADTGKPLFIFDMGDGRARWWTLPHNYRYKPLSFRLAMCAAPVRMRRDISNIQAALVDAGRASWLCSEALAEQVQLLQADAPVATRVASLAEAELQAAAQAVRQLVTTP